MKVLIDHVGHPDLDYSLYALFSERLKADVYSPDGSEEWWNHKVSTGSRYMVSSTQVKDDITYMSFIGYPHTHKVISFQKFLDTEFDVIVTTCWENELPLLDVVKKYKPHAVFIRHIANIREQAKICKNVLLSTLEPMHGPVNWIKYHPEHLKDYSFTEPTVFNRITSFSHHLPDNTDGFVLWEGLKAVLPEFEFKLHGQGGRDLLIEHVDMPDAMKNITFLFHCKAAGCGYLPRQALCCGRPVITDGSQAVNYNTLCSKIYKDGYNCVDINPKVRSLQEAADIIRSWAKPDIYFQKCKDAERSFREVVDFEKEAENIATWISTLSKGV
jgi:hypothetical protein